MMLRLLLRTLLIVAVGLSIPLIAMHYTTDVLWSEADFAMAAVLLSVIAIAITVQTATPACARWMRWSATAVIIIGLLLWLELAVGVVGTPWAGS